MKIKYFFTVIYYSEINKLITEKINIVIICEFFNFQFALDFLKNIKSFSVSGDGRFDDWLRPESEFDP